MPGKTKWWITGVIFAWLCLIGAFHVAVWVCSALRPVLVWVDKL